MTDLARDARPTPLTVVVIAKAPLAGLVKTRLSPPFTPGQAAALAAAALADTWTAVLATPDVQAMCAMEGTPTGWVPAGVLVVAQRGDCLGERIEAAFEDAFSPAVSPGGPVLIVGMDTPQLSPALLTEARDALTTADAVLGAAADGGWWALGLRRPPAGLIATIPTSRSDTGQRQRAALLAAGLTVADLPVLRDVDNAADADAVAALVPDGRFAAVLSDLRAGAAA